MDTSVDRLTNAEKDFIQETCRVALDSRLPVPLATPLQMQSIDFTDPEQVHEYERVYFVVVLAEVWWKEILWLQSGKIPMHISSADANIASLVEPLITQLDCNNSRQ